MRAGLFVMLAMLGACTAPEASTLVGPGLPTRPAPLTGSGPFIVSDPTGPVGGASFSTSSSTLSDEFAYISAAPGTYAEDATATVRVDRTGAVVSSPLTDGGLDPVAIPAAVGDTLTLTLTFARAPAQPQVFRFVVPVAKPPVIVRTVPPRSKREVPLNALLTVVFSEPIDAQSLTPTNFALSTAGRRVAGRLRFTNSVQTTVEFVPDGQLEPSTAYTLDVAGVVRDLDGVVTGIDASIAFTTTSQAGPTAVGSITVSVLVNGFPFVPVRFVMSLDGSRDLPVPSNGSASYSNLAQGSYVVLLRDIPTNCVPRGTASRQVTMTHPIDVSVDYVVDCTPVSVVGQLAFVRDSQMFTINADGTGLTPLSPTPRTFGNAAPAWSPDGKRLAFASTRGARPLGPGTDRLAYDIYVMNADGSNVVRRTTTGPHNTSPSWSPDGRRIVYEATDGADPGVFVIAADDDGGAPERVTPGAVFDPAWSPQGEYVVYTRNRPTLNAYWFGAWDIFRVNLDGSGEVIVIDGTSPTGALGKGYLHPAWTRGGQQLAIVQCLFDDPWGGSNVCDAPYGELVIANADGTGVMVVSRAPGAARPSWAPDGRTLAFGSTGCVGCVSFIRFARIDGGGEGLIVANGHSPAWRP